MTTSLSATLARLGQPRLLVLGDYLLERTTWGNAERISPEAPVLVLRTDRRETRAGGAGNVCNMLRAMNAEATALGRIGDDDAGVELHHLLREAGIAATGLQKDASYSTTQTERFIGRAAMRHAHQILRVEDDQSASQSADVERRLLASLSDLLPRHQALLISDHGYGGCTATLTRAAVAAARETGIPVVIDPGEAVDYQPFRGATLVTPNRRQAQSASGMAIRQPKDALLAGCWLCEHFGLAAVAIKLDRDGLALVTADGFEHVFSTRAREVYDVTGARDMVLATFGLCLAGGVSWEQAAALANLAAGLKVAKAGAACVTRDELATELAHHETGVDGKLVSLEQMTRLANDHRRQGRTLVFTNGCFDLLHVGHVTYLQQAAALGDVLVVGINSDSSVRALKGPERPIYNQQVRAALLGALDCVDHVLIFDDATPHALLWAIRPEVLIKGGTYTPDEVVGREVVQAYGGRVCVAGMVEGVSTTAIVNVVRQRDSQCRVG